MTTLNQRSITIIQWNYMGLLRLYYALCVLLGHIGINYLVSPIYAVQGFYIISGFYISMILNERYNTPIANITYYKKRFLRLMPTYWMVAFLSLLIALCYFYHHDSNILFFWLHSFSVNYFIFIIIVHHHNKHYCLGTRHGLFSKHISRKR